MAPHEESRFSPRFLHCARVHANRGFIRRKDCIFMRWARVYDISSTSRSFLAHTILETIYIYIVARDCTVDDPRVNRFQSEARETP
jgi:hypothetical protein